MNTPVKKLDLTLTRRFNAPMERVWEAWVDPEQVKQWWGPDGFTAPLAKMDFREGGTSLVCMTAPQFGIGDQYSTWTYEKIVPHQRIDYIHHLADSAGNPIDPTSVGMPPDFPQPVRNTVLFKPVGDNETELTVTEYDWTEGQMMEMSKLGLEQCLNKLAKVVERG
jgi:uncharacterized protein YndB with AHSA1/START domain